MILADGCSQGGRPLERLLPGQCQCSTLGQYFVLHCTCAHGLVFRHRLRGALAGQESAVGCESIDVVFLSLRHHTTGPLLQRQITASP